MKNVILGHEKRIDSHVDRGTVLTVGFVFSYEVTLFQLRIGIPLSHTVTSLTNL